MPTKEFIPGVPFNLQGHAQLQCQEALCGTEPHLRQLRTQEWRVKSWFACWCIGLSNPGVLLVGERKAHPCQEQARAVWKAYGVQTGGPWAPEVPPLAFSHLLLRHKTQQQSGRGQWSEPVNLAGAGKGEQVLGVGTGVSGGRIQRRVKDPGKGTLGRRPRRPGKVMREGSSGPGEGRGVLASGLWVSEERHWVSPISGESCRVWGQKRIQGCGGE